MALYQCEDCDQYFNSRSDRGSHDCPANGEEDEEEELPEFEEVVGSDDEEEEHECDECGETFDSPQALSGHRSAH